MSTTIDEISRRTKVSKCTVYRILKGQNKETWASSRDRAERVRKIAMELGYRPNSAARSVREGSFKQIACVTTRLEGDHSRSFIGYLDAAADALLKRGYLMVMESFLLEGGTGKFTNPQKLFSENSVDGILAIISSGYCPKQIELNLQRLNLPIVWINHKPSIKSCCVLSEESQSINDMLAHFKTLGHKKVVYLTPEYSHYSVSSRNTHLQVAANAFGIELDILTSAARPRYMRSLAREFLEKHADATGIIFFHRSMMDVFLLEVVQQGFDARNLSIAHFMFPAEQGSDREFPMTAVQVPHQQMVLRGTELLFDMIKNKNKNKGVYEIPAEFKVGETTFPINR
jgi:DNA-binding LacI/PurR family transcriptional regulator